MYGQERFVNTQETQERSEPRKELSPAQLQMVEKLKAAHEADRAEAKKAFSDKVYAKLPENPLTDRAKRVEWSPDFPIP